MPQNMLFATLIALGVAFTVAAAEPMPHRRNQHAVSIPHRRSSRAPTRTAVAQSLATPASAYRHATR